MVVVGVPMTYPPLEVNGICVSGFDTPNTDCEFTYPGSFRKEILEKVEDFTFERRYRSRDIKDTKKFKQYIDWLKRQADQQVEILRMGMGRDNWDAAMVLLRSFDELLHCGWKLLDFRIDSSSDPRSAVMEKYFRELDEVIGDLLAIAEENEATVWVMSDHGGQKKRGNIYINRMLRDLGYLQEVPRRWEFLRKLLKKKRKRTAHPLGKRFEPIKGADEVDWSGTKAWVSEINIYADLNIQVKGKQPNGIVEVEQKEEVLEQLIEALQEAREDGGEKLLEIVARPQELYGLKDGEVDEHFPDLILGQREGYLFRSQISGKDWLREDKAESMSGTHSMNGMFAALGKTIKQQGDLKAEIVDVAPTILAGLGLPVTEDMNGRVLTEVFKEAPTVEREATQKIDRGGDYNYSQKEEDELSSRLADLGYL
jgi:predicted AlkP superfamily phosphohydrolase/phosphomutase